MKIRGEKGKGCETRYAISALSGFCINAVRTRNTMPKLEINTGV